MSAIAPADLERRVLLRTATAKDAVLTGKVLERAGILAHACNTTHGLVEEMKAGAGALLIAEEMLVDPQFRAVMAQLHTQAPWSDLPVLVLARTGADSTAVVEAMELLANVTVIERPLRISALISTVGSALRARQRQYQMRTMLSGLEEADERKTQFLATLAHELRNPLAPLTTALAIVARPDIELEEARSYFEMMQRQIDHMVRLIGDLMEVSRITRGKVELRLEPLALDQVIKEAIELSRPQIDGARHALRLDIPEGDWVLEGDGVRLTQVFANLLNNAAKYTPPRGLIEVVVERDGPLARVRIRDNGVGLPPEMLTEIFGIFVQVPRNSQVAQGGLGIGLTLVKSLVELHGGRVHATSGGSGLGSELVVELPLATAASGTPAVDAGAPALSKLSKRILVVDDNRDAANSLVRLLKSLGAEPLVAYDAFDALDIAAQVRPDVAILDIGMPVMDGCELARRLRADPGHAGLMLVALSGWGQNGDRERFTAAGFDHHLLKPADLSELVALIGATAAPRAAS